MNTYITHALCVPEQCAFVCEGHVLERCVALGRKLRHLQLLPHQSTKGLIVSARSRRVYAWLWGHHSLNNSWPSPCFEASFYQNGAAKIRSRSVAESAVATSGGRAQTAPSKSTAGLHSKTIPTSGSFFALLGLVHRNLVLSPSLSPPSHGAAACRRS